MSVIDQVLMQEALKLAREAAQKDEVPVGAVIAHHNKIIARAHNQVEMLKDPTAHAEMIAITQAANYLSSKWLQECTIYVTIEPCSMCTGALILARIKKICFGARDPKTGACGSIVNLAQQKDLNHKIEVCGEILSEECGMVLSNFFKKKRSNTQSTNVL